MWSSVFHSGDGSITPEYDVSSINLSASAFWQCLQWCKVVQGGARGWWWWQLHVVCIAMTIVVDGDGGINVGVPQQQLSRIRPEFGFGVRFRVSPGEKERRERGNGLDMADNICAQLAGQCCRCYSNCCCCCSCCCGFSSLIVMGCVCAPIRILC